MKQKKANPIDKRKEGLDAHCPFRTCYVCDRESRDLMMVGPSKFRHDDCNPGSPNWIDYYAKVKKSEKTSQGNELYNHATRTK